MELHLLNILSYIFSIAFIILLLRTYRPSVLKKWWEKSKQQILQKSAIKKAESEGLTAFYFERGKVVVMAKTQAGAKSKYETLRKEAQNARKQSNLKKV